MVSEGRRGLPGSPAQPHHPFSSKGTDRSVSVLFLYPPEAPTQGWAGRAWGGGGGRKWGHGRASIGNRNERERDDSKERGRLSWACAV